MVTQQVIKGEDIEATRQLKFYKILSIKFIGDAFFADLTFLQYGY